MVVWVFRISPFLCLTQLVCFLFLFSSAIIFWFSKTFDVMFMWKGCSASYTCWARCSCGQRCSWVRFHFCNSISSAIHTKGSLISNASPTEIFSFILPLDVWLIFVFYICDCIFYFILWMTPILSLCSFEWTVPLLLTVSTIKIAYANHTNPMQKCFWDAYRSLITDQVLLDCGAVQADALTVDRLASLEKVNGEIFHFLLASNLFPLFFPDSIRK